MTKIYVTNKSDAESTLKIETRTDVPIVQVRTIPVAAASVIGIYLLYLLIHWLLPGISTIALATSKEAVAQPLYVLALVIGAFLLMLYIIIPYNTFGEDVKMYKDSGLMTIMVLAFLVAVWTASVSVADEIDGRTALTLLSKPISRREFVLGKFLGIVWANLLMFIVLGAWMMVLVSYKVVYDARETANPEPAWQLCATEMLGTVPGLVLSFMETVVLTAISVAISTRLSDPAEPRHLRIDLRARPLGPADRAIIDRPKRVRGLLRPTDRADPAGARPFQHPSRSRRRRPRAARLFGVGRALLRAVFSRGDAARADPVRRSRLGVITECFTCPCVNKFRSIRPCQRKIDDLVERLT